MSKCSIGSVCNVINGFAFKSDKYISKGFRVIRITNVQKGFIEDKLPKFYSLDEYDSLSKYHLFEQDLLISLTGNVGRVALLTKEFLPAALNQRVACLRVKDETVLDKNYLFTFLNSNIFENSCLESAQGVAQKNMSTEWLKEYEILLPPIAEQKRIADELDKISGLISKRKTQIEKLDLLIKSKFTEMFGDPVTNPMGWSKTILSEYIVFLTSGSRGWAKYFSKSGDMFLTIKNVKNSRISISNIQYVNAPKNKEAERTKVKAHDLLISITADLGRTGVVCEKIAEHGAYINQHLSLIRLDRKRINPKYLACYLETAAGKRQFNSKNQSAVKAGLNFDALKTLIIIVPPLEMQNNYIAYLEKVETTKEQMNQGLEKLQTLYKAQMQKYFE